MTALIQITKFTDGWWAYRLPQSIQWVCFDCLVQELGQKLMLEHNNELKRKIQEASPEQKKKRLAEYYDEHDLYWHHVEFYQDNGKYSLTTAFV